jgi:VanZ family protein
VSAQDWADFLLRLASAVAFTLAGIGMIRCHTILKPRPAWNYLAATTLVTAVFRWISLAYSAYAPTLDADTRAVYARWINEANLVVYCLLGFALTVLLIAKRREAHE